jgi:DNA-binding response OmpR family regulator
MNSPKQFLIIEDDKETAESIRSAFADCNWRAETAFAGDLGLDLALGREYDLIVLDLCLPGLDGMDICRRIRQEKRYTPILVLTSCETELDRILSLEMGADDFMTKPFSMRELTARVSAILRRIEAITRKCREAEEREVLEYGGLRIDLNRRQAILDDAPVYLTAKEFELLSLLAQNPSRAYSRRDLLGQVWGYHFDGHDHTVNSHIHRLRSKIEEDPSNPRYIRTVWGHGYRFDSDD